MVNNITLVKIGAVGGIATVTMGILFKFKINEYIKATPMYREALSTVRSHPAAVHLLGEPIKDRSIDVGNQKKNYAKDHEAKYEVALNGSKQKGTLYFWAERGNKDEEWEVNRIELELDKEPDRRLLLKNIRIRNNT